MFSSLAGSLLEPEGIRQILNGLLTMNYKSKCLPGGFPNKQTPRLGSLSDGRCRNWKGLNQIKCAKYPLVPTGARDVRLFFYLVFVKTIKECFIVR